MFLRSGVDVSHLGRKEEKERQSPYVWVNFGKERDEFSPSGQREQYIEF